MPVSAEVLLTFTLASIAIVIVPGPSVTVIIANSMTHGSRAGFLNIAGTQAGLVVLIAILVFGLAAIVENMAWWFDWVRLVGAAYLIWLGLKLIFARATADAPMATMSDSGFFWQGFAVILTNPKALLLFGAFLPQFVDPGGAYVVQTVFLGAVFMAVATVFDSIYAVLAGGAGRWLTAARSRLVSRVSGGVLVCGGVWLASLRQN